MRRNQLILYRKKLIFFIMFWTFTLIFFPLLSFGKMTYIDEPMGCWKNQQQNCVVRNLVHSAEYTFKKIHFNVEKDATFKVNFATEENQVIWLEGEGWFQSKDLARLTYLSLTLDFKGEVYISLIEYHFTQQLLVRNLTGEVVVQLYSSIAENLPKGFENRYGFLNSQENWDKGIMKPWDLDPLFKIWASFFPEKERFEKYKLYKSIEKKALKESQTLYKAAIQRRLAAIDEAEEQKKIKAQQQKEREIHYRNMYRKKFFEPDKVWDE